MADDKKVSRVLGLNDMISGPLLAFIDAEVAATLKYVEFIGNFFDHEDSKGRPITDPYNFGRLRTVSFKYQRHGVDSVEEVEMHVPLLSLVPLPVLELVEAKFEFGLRIIAAEENRLAHGARPQKSMQMGIAAGPPQTQPSQNLKLHTMLAPQRNGSDGGGEPRNESNMQVCLHVKHGDLPAGLSAIFSRMGEATYSQTAEPEPEPEKEAPGPEQEELRNLFFWQSREETFTVEADDFVTFEAGYDSDLVTDFQALSGDRHIFTVVEVTLHAERNSIEVRVAGQSEGSAELIVMLKTETQKFLVTKTVNVTRGTAGGDEGQEAQLDPEL